MTLPVVIESPYAASVGRTVEDHLLYLDFCIRWCLENGYTPYASHKMLTTALDDSDPVQRERGIEAGLAMARSIGLVFYFVDLCISPGMRKSMTELGNEVRMEMVSLPDEMMEEYERVRNDPTRNLVGTGGDCVTYPVSNDRTVVFVERCTTHPDGDRFGGGRDSDAVLH